MDPRAPQESTQTKVKDSTQMTSLEKINLGMALIGADFFNLSKIIVTTYFKAFQDILGAMLQQAAADLDFNNLMQALHQAEVRAESAEADSENRHGKLKEEARLQANATPQASTTDQSSKSEKTSDWDYYKSLTPAQRTALVQQISTSTQNLLQTIQNNFTNNVLNFVGPNLTLPSGKTILTPTQSNYRPAPVNKVLEHNPGLQAQVFSSPSSGEGFNQSVTIMQAGIGPLINKIGEFLEKNDMVNKVSHMDLMAIVKTLNKVPGATLDQLEELLLNNDKIIKLMSIDYKPRAELNTSQTPFDTSKGPSLGQRTAKDKEEQEDNKPSTPRL